MPFNGSGTYAAPASSWNPGVDGSPATTADFNALLTDLETGLSNAVTRDGQSPATANIPMGSNRITGLAYGTAITDAANVAQTLSPNPRNVGLAFAVASNALTISLKGTDGNDPSATNPVVIPFRSATAATGTHSVVNVAAAMTVTISSGSTVGSTGAVAQDIFVYALNNAGTVELAFSATDFTDSFIASTTAEGGAGAADSATVLYSTTARSNVSISKIGRFTHTQATAGLWAAVPTTAYVGRDVTPFGIRTNGSASVPTFAVVGDTNTGFYSSAADTLNITTGGTERVVLSTSTLAVSLPTTIQGNGVPLSVTSANANQFTLTMQGSGSGYANFGAASGALIIGSSSGNVGLRIDTSDNVLVGAATQTNATGLGSGKHYVQGVSYITQTGNSSPAAITYASGTSFANVMHYYATASVNATSWSFADYYSSINGTSDKEFNLRGDGNAFADGSWTGGGADFAELCEWADGNVNNEDRRGIPVVFVQNSNGKRLIRPATKDDDVSLIFGAVSANPTVIGGGGWNNWTGKYQRDDFGAYLRNEKGERILNPAWDESQEYTPRHDRKEFSPIGIKGFVRIRNGFPVNPAWLLSSEVNERLKEYLL